MAQEGGPPGGSTDQEVPGVSHLGISNFSGPVSSGARALLWGKVQLMGALPCHELRNLLK